MFVIETKELSKSTADFISKVLCDKVRLTMMTDSKVLEYDYYLGFIEEADRWEARSEDLYWICKKASEKYEDCTFYIELLQ